MERVEIRLSGTGGQGLILGAMILAESLIAEGLHVAQSQAYEPVSRGGVSRSDLVAGSALPEYPLVTELDALLLLDQCAVDVSAGLVRAGGLVLLDVERVPQPPPGELRRVALPLVATARRVGSVRVANMVALGALAELGGFCTLDSLRAAVRGGVPAAFLEPSLAGLDAGAELARTLSA